jgi:hypothetical protein
VSGLTGGVPELPAREPRLPRFAWLLVGGGLALAVAAVIAAGQGEVPLAPAGPPPVVPANQGQTLFVAAGCTACHDPSGRDSPLAPGLAGVAARAAARIGDPGYRGEAKSVAGYLEESIIDHCADPLPGYDCTTAPDVSVRLSMSDVASLVRYLLTLGEADAP